MNWISQGLPLGRWFNIRVVLHSWFIIYAAWILFSSQNPKSDGFFLAVLFGIVLLHEFGHALACRTVGGTADLIVLTPFGGLAFCNPPPRPWPQLITTACGPLVNALLIPLCWLGLMFVVPLLPEGSLAGPVVFSLFESGLVINGALLAFNLLPIYPLDGGRLFQEILWFFIGYPRSLLVSGMMGTCGGLALVGLGIGLTRIVIPLPQWWVSATGGRMPALPLGGNLRNGDVNLVLVGIGALAAWYSWATYRRAQEIGGWQKR